MYYHEWPNLPLTLETKVFNVQCKYFFRSTNFHSSPKRPHIETFYISKNLKKSLKVFTKILSIDNNNMFL